MAEAYSGDDVGRLLRELRPLSAKMVEEGQRIAKQTRHCPPRLFHYTDTNALMGMVENKEIWATNASYLNDEQELVWGTKVFCEALDAAKAKNDREVDLLGRMKSAADLSKSGLSFYIASFSEEADDLTQWRGYGAGQGPVCIGFDSSHLYLAFEGYDLISVVYDRKEQDAIANSIVSMVLDFYRVYESGDNPAIVDHLIPHCVQAFRNMSGYAALRFKSAHWRSEREWRLVVASDGLEEDDNSISFRAGKYGIVPFIKVKPPKYNPVIGVGIDGIIAGPTPHRELTVQALFFYMRRKHLMIRNNIKASTVTMR
ncbi:DUF2971 domain-containing protein [Sphingomonas dokdonensis]|uniref:DUF2971 domain-containing protein n=1 Tax=Sphingomonas dokdonensis TaxID=344880 RepID=UPI001303318D|nr:DUF2971 domain-containing protein [Sphingomonas dokdonensis]